MTQFADLVTKAWAYAKCPQAPLYLAGHDCEGYALLSDEATAYTESFILRCEEATGCTFERVPVDQFAALQLEYDYYLSAYQRVESKNYWSDSDRRWWSELGMKVADLRKAIQAIERIEDEEELAHAHNESQFGVGA